MAEVVDTDSSGVELYVGDRVRDVLFGLGTITGTAAVAGGGTSARIRWDTTPEAGQDGGRSGTYLTKQQVATGQPTARVTQAHTGAEFESGAVHRRRGGNE